MLLALLMLILLMLFSFIGFIWSLISSKNDSKKERSFTIKEELDMLKDFDDKHPPMPSC